MNLRCVAYETISKTLAHIHSALLLFECHPNDWLVAPMWCHRPIANKEICRCPVTDYKCDKCRPVTTSRPTKNFQRTIRHTGQRFMLIDREFHEIVDWSRTLEEIGSVRSAASTKFSMTFQTADSWKIDMRKSAFGLRFPWKHDAVSACRCGCLFTWMVWRSEHELNAMTTGSFRSTASK